MNKIINREVKSDRLFQKMLKILIALIARAQ